MKINRHLILYIIGLIIYGSNGVIVRQIGLGSEHLVFLRSLIGMLFLIIICLIFKKDLLRTFRFKEDLLFISFSGFAMAADWLLLFEAYKQINVSLAILINYAGPIIVMLLSPLFFRDRLTLRNLFIVLLGFIGFCLIGGSDLSSNSINMSGLILAILSSFAYALMVLFNKKATLIIGIENATLQLFFCFIGVTLYLTVTKNLQFSVESAQWFPILWLCIVNTGLGSLFYFSSIGSLSVSTVSLYGYLEPLSGLFFSIIFLDERLSLLQIIGAILILFGPLLKSSENSI